MLVAFLVTVVDADVVTVKLFPDRTDMTTESPLTAVTVPDAKPPPGPAPLGPPGPNPGRPLPAGGFAPPEVGLVADIGPISVMCVAEIVDPDVAPVTEMRSPSAIEPTPTVFATVTRVELDVSTLTAVFETVSLTVSTLPAIDAIVPNVPCRPPGPPNPSPPAGVGVPVVADALAFVSDHALAPKNPPARSANTPATAAHPTHAGRGGADRDTALSTATALGSIAMFTGSSFTGSSSGSLGTFIHRVSTHYLRARSQSPEDSMRTPCGSSVNRDKVS